jgi:hypothetical protein
MDLNHAGKVKGKSHRLPAWWSVMNGLHTSSSVGHCPLQQIQVSQAGDALSEGYSTRKPEQALTPGLSL